MNEGYVIRDQSLPHFITITVVDWIDVFSRKNYRDTAIECLEYCIKNKGMIVYGYKSHKTLFKKHLKKC